VTGEILAMVGSVDYNNDAIDGRVNVTIRPRQPGSTIKAVTYASAMERGMGTGDVIWDTRVLIPQPGQAPYEPRNYDRNYH
ncbi:MAG TPA: penicillin-binding transpeptidase domain-containing protein, partial [Aggregatilineales bacterium]|nr:penicillin-binding transpeptidase domain-containing protein [Aggregatilineales bacterium]